MNLKKQVARVMIVKTTLHVQLSTDRSMYSQVAPICTVI